MYKLFAWAVGQIMAVGLTLILTLASARAGEKIVLRFNETHGSRPSGGLTSDGAGNFYGTTYYGGKENCGTAFQLSPGSGGGWTETVMYSFQDCSAMRGPTGTLAIDKLGNLFGTQVGFFTPGVVFELSKANGVWTYSVVHTFASNEDGPNGDLTLDTAGNLYGVTSQEVFELTPQASGSWNETVLYTFPAPNGVSLPNAGVVPDSKGNLYGTAYVGERGSFGGAVYELSPQANGTWGFTVIYQSSDSSNPNSRLIFDSKGDLYGTASDSNYGQVFELSPSTDGAWTETAIYHFASGSDASYPYQATLVFDASGNLYGTTGTGGLGCNRNLCGVAYKLSPQGKGIWKETVLHQFESAEDGSQPQEGLVLDSSGNLFGTTSFGGSRYGYGTVFEITP